MRSTDKQRFDARCHGIDLEDLSILNWEVAGQLPSGPDRDKLLHLANACSQLSARLVTWADTQARKAHR